MSSFKCAPRAIIAAWVGLAAGLSAPSEARSQTAPGTIADLESVYIDGETFTIVPGHPKPDAAAAIRGLGGRALGRAAIIYRSGDQLYILGAPLVLGRIQPSEPDRPAVDAGLSQLYVLGAPLVLERSQPGKPDRPAVGADREQLGRIRIQYEPPKNPEHQELYQSLQENRVLETVLEILAPLRLPNPGLLIKTMGCDGMINSWYNNDDPGDAGPTVHMCYELLQNIINITPAEEVRPNVTQHDAITGQFMFWTLHETGHAVFDIFQVPLFGREEDAADLFAAYIMLHFGRDQARRWVEGAAYTSDEFMADVPWGKNYASVHGLPEQRFYNLICLAYGADPATFADVTGDMANMLTKHGALPKRRADDCNYEFQSMDRAFKTQIRPHIDPEMAKRVFDTAWFPEPLRRPDPPSPTLGPAQGL
jgi:hypothetical protein